MTFKTNKVCIELNNLISEKVKHLENEYKVKINYITDLICKNVNRVIIDIYGNKIISRTEFIVNSKNYIDEVTNFFELIEAYIMENELDIDICIACSKKPALPDDVLCAGCKNEIEAIKIW